MHHEPITSAAPIQTPCKLDFMTRILAVVLGQLACGSRAASPPPAPTPPPVRAQTSTKAPETADADHDGITDVDDVCPDQPETRNEWEDEDGCPDQNCEATPRMVTCLVSPIYFTRGSATISTEHDDIIEAMVTDLAKYSNIVRVEIRGQTATDEPKRLALERAQRVVDKLVARGVAADRLRTSAGVPIAKPRDGADNERRVDYALETRPIENGGSRACTAFGPVEVTTPTVCK